MSLEVSGLGIRFGGLVAINNVSLSVAAGGITGLIGPNGAGKTTFFNLITGVYRPTSGEIRFAGRALQGLAPHEICRLGVARTFQNIRLFKDLTVLENLLVALHPERHYSLSAALLRLPRFRRGEMRLQAKAMGLLKRLDLEGMADLTAGSLPYGAQRRVEIARALATGPQLLLLDEPAAGMNPTETAQLADHLARIRRDFNLTVLLIEHDMSLVMKICERLHVLDHGELIASGAPAEIRADPCVIEAYLGGGLGDARHA